MSYLLFFFYSGHNFLKLNALTQAAHSNSLMVTVMSIKKTHAGTPLWFEPDTAVWQWSNEHKVGGRRGRGDSYLELQCGSSVVHESKMVGSSDPLLDLKTPS